MDEQKTGNEECFGEMLQGVPQRMPQERLEERLKKCFGECEKYFKLNAECCGC